MNIDIVAVTNRVVRLQGILKVYLIAVGGEVSQLGGIACSLVDVLEDICGEVYVGAAERIDVLSIAIVKSIYTSVVERLEELNDSGADTHRSALTRVESEVDLLPHLLFLKSILVDFSISAKEDCTAMTQKIQELINGLKS